MPYRGINGRKSGAVRQRQSANRGIHNGIERGDGTVTLSDAIYNLKMWRDIELQFGKHADKTKIETYNTAISNLEPILRKEENK